nr:pentatricopeptide repeat-containing protein [Tanacetum cinerariifolium]
LMDLPGDVVFRIYNNGIFMYNPPRNDMKGKVLFIDMYCAKDKGFEMTPPLNHNEVGIKDFLLNVSDLENDIVNDAAKILDGMTASKNDASKGNGISIRENDGHNVVLTHSKSNYSDHEYKGSKSDNDQSDKSFDYLSDGENELIKLRKRMRQPKLMALKSLMRYHVMKEHLLKVSIQLLMLTGLEK